MLSIGRWVCRIQESRADRTTGVGCQEEERRKREGGAAACQSNAKRKHTLRHSTASMVLPRQFHGSHSRSILGLSDDDLEKCRFLSVEDARQIWGKRRRIRCLVGGGFCGGAGFFIGSTTTTSSSSAATAPSTSDTSRGGSCKRTTSAPSTSAAPTATNSTATGTTSNSTCHHRAPIPTGPNSPRPNRLHYAGTSPFSPRRKRGVCSFRFVPPGSSIRSFGRDTCRGGRGGRSVDWSQGGCFGFAGSALSEVFAGRCARCVGFSREKCQDFECGRRRGG
mmetsp:Transcript_29463/g.59446  ORF Transcript_29463/g.59446 Transcript_29463/m.59446 type:complete len:279 (-) Transcript_29463:633-1469(-)